MGTALTERQLKELARLTRRLFLCFDADAAGQEATLRGMELALAQGFDVQVVALPKGTRSRPTTRRRSSSGSLEPVSYPVHRVRLEHERARDRQAAFAAIRDLPRVACPTRRSTSTRCASRPTCSTSRRRRRPGSRRPAAARARRESSRRGCSTRAQRLERGALAGVAAHPELLRLLEQIGPEHFDDPLHRRARAHLLGEEPADGELTPLLAELYALAAEDGITVETTEQMLLRLRERRLQRELAEADEGRMVDLQQALLEDPYADPRVRLAARPPRLQLRRADPR